MSAVRRPREELSVNLTPLIDVVFLLLIFFMVTTTFTKETRLTLTLPEAEAQPATSMPPDLIEITIGVDGRYAINGRVLVKSDPALLKKALIEVSDGDNRLPLVITADAQVPYQLVVTAMDVVGQLGFNRINMTTKRPIE